jgi:dienelactone hydrolase
MSGRLIFFVVFLMVMAGCARMPDTGVTELRPATITELRTHIKTHKPDLEQFRVRGPFEVAERPDFELRLSPKERFAADLYLTAVPEKAPLVIILHGYDGWKEAHHYQALHLASWGMHAVALQLAQRSQWTRNGRNLARIVQAIKRSPEIIDKRIDVDRIYLVGHSFGATSVAIALAEGAPAAGGILLDPAGIGKDLPNYLRQVKVPVMLLGADRRVFTARNRDFFYRFVPSNVVEVSIRGATHEDALYPASAASPEDMPATEEMQITFVSAITAAAFSLANTGSLDYAWASLNDALTSGRFFNAKRK